MGWGGRVIGVLFLGRAGCRCECEWQLGFDVWGRRAWGLGYSHFSGIFWLVVRRREEGVAI